MITAAGRLRAARLPAQASRTKRLLSGQASIPPTWIRFGCRLTCHLQQHRGRCHRRQECGLPLPSLARCLPRDLGCGNQQPAAPPHLPGQPSHFPPSGPLASQCLVGVHLARTQPSGRLSRSWEGGNDAAASVHVYSCRATGRAGDERCPISPLW
ncbi:hypothetical protein M433DRAFT_397234 [Acidomyces richmondensis BFW]|nr:MAG: hypothetical protein FE78DRAFT_206520 [Acidomyces sp. 'richmondensis']KYG42666.1 hypothetical protein M433DRAFT_397234 [Acidomyces richmondensis BFW]